MALSSKIQLKVRPTFLVLITVLIATQIILLTPGSLEKSQTYRAVGMTRSQVIELFRPSGPLLAPGIPPDAIPSYAIRKMDYTSTKSEKKEFRIFGELAHLYDHAGEDEADRLTHIRKMTALLYDEEGKATVITGKEAKYLAHARTLEVFGEVKTVFPDGYEFYSEYLKYLPNEKLIHIPTDYFVRGHSGDKEDSEKKIIFQSYGLDSDFDTSEVLLHSRVNFTMTRTQPRDENTEGVADYTTIQSDKAKILRDKKISYFTMEESRPLRSRFVRINQPDMFVRSRRAQLNYGEFEDLLQYMVANDDVFIRELKEDSEVQYATCGQAEFDTKKNVIRLTHFPQAYQGNDTVTGDVIRLLRDEDIVEVDYSNAYSEGQEQEKRKTSPRRKR